jgi:6-pyruvoyltetrahydropterin/6-carboxytetrahydropterin synthase
MVIRKLFKFENAHIVRDCSTLRCSQNIHGHSYIVEVLLESNYLDNGQMVYDFGLTKLYIKEFIDSFDHAITLWSEDSKEYINDMKKHSQRWIELPVSPSAEQFSRVFFVVIDKILSLSTKNNNEKEVKVNSIIVHETQTGYAQCFREDAYSKLMGEIDIESIIFSKQIQNEWKNQDFWQNILNGNKLLTPKFV